MTNESAAEFYPSPDERISIDWSKFTFEPLKIQYYPREIEGRMIWEFLTQDHGAGALRALYKHTFILLKPETARKRLTRRIVELLFDSGFEVAAMKSLRLRPVEERFIWRYQWNKATADRMALSALKSQFDDGVLLLLRDASRTSPIPASIRLHDLKGSSAFPELRRPEQLRTIIGATNKTLTFVHCPDEPADVLREAAVFYERPGDFVQGLSATSLRSEEVLDRLVGLEEQVLAHSLSTAEVRSRRPDLPVEISSRPPLLPEILRFFGSMEDERERWDLITVAADLISYHRTHEDALISTRTMPQVVDAWKAACPDC